MDAKTSPLILTKLRVPAVRSHAVVRTRLLTRLLPQASESNPTGVLPGANLPDEALVLVCAPAGYGKTTLLSEWAHALRGGGTAVAWYALDASDNAPATFSAYLLAALDAALGPATALTQVAGQLRTAPETDLLSLLPSIINAVAGFGRACALILDDYHLIESPMIHAALAAFIERRPENLRVVIGSRSDPPLGLARLRVRGELREVRAGELRFTPDEAEQFLTQAMALDLPSELITVLAERTEGWAAGLQLAALSLVGRRDPGSVVAAFSGSHRHLAQYLLEEVVARQPPALQQFLLATSVLERLCLPLGKELCDAFTGADATALRPDARREPGGLPDDDTILAKLEADNLFLVALDDRSCWYRYHHLFRDFLAARLQKIAPEQIPVLHRAAAEWHGAHGNLTEAVHHAFLTHDREYAAATVERHCFAMMMRSELSTIYEWCAAFSEEIMQAHPLLCIHQAWSLVLGARSRNRRAAEARLRQAEAVAAALSAPGRSTSDRAAAYALNDHAATVRSYLAIMPDPGLDPHRELNLALVELAAYREEDTSRFSTLLRVGYAHLACQHATEAEEALLSARRLAAGVGLFYGIIETTYQLANLAHNCGHLGRAEAVCHEARSLVARTFGATNALSSSGPNPPEGMLPALGSLDVALGCVHLEQGRLAEAEQELLRGLTLVGDGAYPYPLASACLALYHLRKAQGRHAEALEYLARLEEAWPDVAFCTRGLRAVHFLASDPRDAVVLAAATAWKEDFERHAAPLGPARMPAFGMGPLGGAELYYRASLAWVRCHLMAEDAGTAHEITPRAYLARQTALAQKRGLTIRAHELLLLASLPLSATPSNLGSPAQPPPPAVDALSERELEVLRLMARGASNQEIADALIITVGTVKSHVNHILSKLASRNRTEAVARARAAGLLDV